jgi:hypothetical protein
MKPATVPTLQKAEISFTKPPGEGSEKREKDVQLRNPYNLCVLVSPSLLNADSSYNRTDDQA